MILGKASLLLILGLLTSSAIGSAFHTSASNIVSVNPGQSIQAAINSASGGDTIFIASGTYRESLIIVNKTVTLLGEDPRGTIVDGDRAENATVILNIIVSNVKIKNLTVQNTTAGYGYIGVHLAKVQNVEVSGCIIKNTGMGIRLYNSSGCRIEGNRILDNSGTGIELQANGTDNLIRDNLVANNSIGIHAEEHSGTNQIYRNNFVDNGLQVAGLGLGSSRWDNGYPSGGNYWSDYSDRDSSNGPDQDLVGSDGIGDKPYPSPALALDNYPFVGLIHMFWAGNWGNDYYVWIASNSTSVVDFIFSNSSIPNLQFNVSGLGLLTHSCRVAVPKQLMWVDSSPEWQVLVNGTTASPFVCDDTNCTYFYLSYTYAMFENSKSIQISGTHTIPETTWPMFVVALAALACQTALTRRARAKTRLHQDF